MFRATSARRPGAVTALTVSGVALTSCAALAWAPGVSTPASARPADAKRPNVLMITVDDASRDNLKHMPHVRQLIGQRGVTMTNAVAPTPICVPARASLLTGQYAHNHGVRTISGPHGGFGAFRDERTLPVWLRRVGYDTMFIGKYLNGYGQSKLTRSYVPPGWTDWRATVGFSTYNYLRPQVNINGRVRGFSRYNSDLFSDWTVQQINKPRRKKRPWFLMVNYVAPHAGGPREADDPISLHPGAKPPVTTPHVSTRYRDAFPNLRLPTTPNMFEADISDKATASHTDRQWTKVGRQSLREANQQRVESLQSVDLAVARAVRALRRTGQLRNTVITFSSDNGYLVGQHNRQAKLIHYEQSLTVPMLMAGPGIPQGRRVRTQVTNPDLATTIAAIAHARPTRPQDGVNVLPLLRKGARNRVVPIQAWPVENGTVSVYQGVRTGVWTYVLFRNGEEELYNRSTDPYQLENLAGRKGPEIQRTLVRMRQLSATQNVCKASTCDKPS